jgi:hypothetical protein
MIEIPEDKMRTQDISFCSKVATNILLSDAKQAIMDSVNAMLETSRYFYKSSYKYANILNKNSLSYLSKQPHLITVKTGGSNYFLFLIKLNGINTCLFIDRKTKQGYTLPRIITVKYKFHESLYSGTLFDGELLRDKNENWMFLLSNIVVYKGQTVNDNIITRFNLMYSILTKEYTEDPIFDTCYIRVKKIYKYSDYDKLLLMYIPKFNYEIRGLYFNSFNIKFSNHLFMLTAPSKKEQYTKKSNDNTRNGDGGDAKTTTTTTPAPSPATVHASALNCTFSIKETDSPDIYDLYCLKNSAIDKYGIAFINKMKISKLLKSRFEEKKGNCFVNCKYNDRFKKWEVIEIIDDKSVSIPSDYDTIKKYEN